MPTTANVLTGHDLQLIAAVREAIPDSTSYEIACALYDGRSLEQLEELIRLYLAVGSREALSVLSPVRAMTAAEVDEVAPSQLPAEGDELDLRAQWGDR